MYLWLVTGEGMPGPRPGPGSMTLGISSSGGGCAHTDHRGFRQPGKVCELGGPALAHLREFKSMAGIAFA